jgi:hypothetical protein
MLERCSVRGGQSHCCISNVICHRNILKIVILFVVAQSDTLQKYAELKAAITMTGGGVCPQVSSLGHYAGSK